MLSIYVDCRAQWPRGRASDSRLREPGFESCLRLPSLFIIFVNDRVISSMFAIASNVQRQCLRQELSITSVISYTNSERSGSGVELRTLDYENPGSNPVLRC